MQPLDSSRLTRHFVARAHERRLRLDVLAFILAHGVDVDGDDARSVTVVDKHLPPDLVASPVARRARGWVIVMSRDGALLTCYRREDAAKFLKRKGEKRYHAPRAA